MKIYFSQFYHLLHANHGIEKLSGPQQKGDLSIIRIPSAGCMPKHCCLLLEQNSWLCKYLVTDKCFIDLDLLFWGLFLKVLKLIQKSMGLALLKGFHVHDNGIYYSSALWKCLLDHKAQVAASVAGGCMKIFLDGSGKRYWALEPRGMINRHVSI